MNLILYMLMVKYSTSCYMQFERFRRIFHHSTYRVLLGHKERKIMSSLFVEEVTSFFLSFTLTTTICTTSAHVVLSSFCLVFADYFIYVSVFVYTYGYKFLISCFSIVLLSFLFFIFLFTSVIFLHVMD